MSLLPWHRFHDTFPANESPGLPGTAGFDTTTAYIKTGLNIAQTTGDPWRFDVPGDSLVVASVGHGIRLDLLFRIRPGVGNHVVVGLPQTGLRRVVPNAGAGAITPGDGTFFGSFMQNPGAFGGMPGAVNPGVAVGAHAAAPGGWSPIVWNSARMDTAEAHGYAMFPVQAVEVGSLPPATHWCSTFHEEELAQRPTLGIPHNRCFLIDTLSNDTSDPNVNCGAKAPYPPAWVTALPPDRTGWDGQTTTPEGTKILPDGLLTPGAHVQYFVRRQRLVDPPALFTMVPDTNMVCPQRDEGFDMDGHRWQHFGVLPDRWKDPDLVAPLPAPDMLCVSWCRRFLVIDWADGRGEERLWKSAMDALTGRCVGSADGYACVPAGDVSPNDPRYYVSNRNAQPGSAWDLYQVRAGDSSTIPAGTPGSRLSHRDPGAGNLVAGREARLGPTLEMLAASYEAIVLLTGDLNRGILGPFDDRSADDVAVLDGWLAGAIEPWDREMLVIGDSFVEAAFDQGPPALDFVTEALATGFQDPNYLLFVPDDRPWVRVRFDTPYWSNAMLLVANDCLWTHDVLDVNAAAAPHAMVEFAYLLENGHTLPLGVRKPPDVEHPWGAQVVGVKLADMLDWQQTPRGLSEWIGTLLSVASVCGFCPPGDVPWSAAPLLVNHADLRGNPVRAGTTIIALGLASADHVQVAIFDLAGRKVRTLVDRRFQPGEHELVWDGRDDAGARLEPGIYFTRVRYRESGFEIARKVTVLR